MIDRILPPGVACAEAFDDPPGATLFPEEEALLTRAVEKRRREFTTGRHCARRALAALGVPPRPLLRGPGGEPAWPPAIVGSITHCQGYRAAAVARAASVATLGIDAEPHAPLPAGVLAAVARDAEQVHLDELARGDPATHWDRLLFCAKETVYKAWYPLAQRWLGFEDAQVTIDPGSRTFTARLLVSGPRVGGTDLAMLTGRWHAADGLVVTAIVVPASPSPLPDEGAWGP